ncbi:MAG: nucleotide-diphospho-sugar transferase [Bacteroidia bacterium]|nr:nucleotide-diphospho-sugar transferase [Bacteroidia bacterium]
MVFNRPDTTKRVFEAIQKAKPPRLYIAADGARDNKEGEKEKVEQVRKFVLENINWQCKVKTLFRDRNLGCKHAVSSAITWFFENEDMGIVLEDDCLPSQSFFWFCEELLKRYKDDMRIWHIGGANFQDGNWRGDADYYFSKYNHVWGWASWANRWKFYDAEIRGISNTDFLNKTFKHPVVRKYWTRVFQTMKKSMLDTWDYQWVFTVWANNGLAIIPNVNMVSNIGFGIDATHTKGENQLVKSHQLILKNHPTQIIVNSEADDYTFKHHYRVNSLFERIVIKLKRYFNAVSSV